MSLPHYGVNSVDEIVTSMLARKALGLDGGQLVANPVPLADQISNNVIEPLIKKSLKEAKELMINAKAVTPFLLNRIFELTAGKSLTTNIALVKNNARLASEISKTFFIRN